MRKKDFPIFQKYKNLVYLDSAATSQKPVSVIDAVRDFYSYDNSNTHRGFYPLAENITKKVEDIRSEIAKFINAKSADQIIFTSGTTHALNLIANSLFENLKVKKTLVTVFEHHSNFVPWQINSKKNNSDFMVIDINNDLEIEMENLIVQAKNAQILSISHISNVLGIINPIKKIIKQVRSVNPSIIIVVDAAQSVSSVGIDVNDFDCDFMVFSGHKMFAGTGIGVLYAKKKYISLLNPMFYGGHMIESVSSLNTKLAGYPQRLEGGTLNIAGIMSLGAAVEYINQVGINKINNYEKEITDYLHSKLKKLGFVNLIKNKINENESSSILSFNIKDIHSHDVAYLLGIKNICVRAGHHCAMPLHRKLGLDSSVRVSISIYNDKRDIDILIKELVNIYDKFENK